MKIVVCVKHVPDATADRHFEADDTVDRVGVDGLLSELDEYAVEQALQIKEKSETADDVTVTALTVGPEKAVDAVRKALQMGADAGVHVLDDAIAGSDAVATSLVLAKAIEKAGAARPGGLRDVLDRRRDERGAGDAGRAARAPAGHPRVGGGDPGRPDPDQARRRHRHRGRRRHAAGGALGHRPVRRGPLPVVQGDHGGEEEAAGDLLAGRPRGRRRARSACRRPGPRSRRPTARPPRTAGEIVKDEDGSGAKALAEFLAAKKFI